MSLLKFNKVILLQTYIVSRRMDVSIFICHLCHASHTKTSIVYSQALRMKRICCRRSGPIVNINKLKHWFRERGYPEEIVNKETKRALGSSISSSSNKSKKNTQVDRKKGIPLVLTYNPFLCHLS